MIRRAILSVEAGDPGRDRLCIRPLRQHDGPEVIIPDEGEYQHGKCGQRGLHQGQDHVPEYPPFRDTFDAGRLEAVAIRLRELYLGTAEDADRVEAKVSTEFISRLVAEVTKGFKGDVGVVPRQFLRELVTQLDLVEEHGEYDPMSEYGFQPVELSAPEQHAIAGGAPAHEDEADEEVPVEQVW